MVSVNVIKTSRNGSLKRVPMELDVEEGDIKIERLITLFVKKMVDDYNKKHNKDIEEMPFYDPNNIGVKKTGVFKLGFFLKDKIDLDKSLETAIYALKDGLYKIIHNKNEYMSLDDILCLKNNDDFLFIKLTFISSSYLGV